MKKRFVTMLLAVSVMASMGSSYAVFAEEAATEAADTKDDAAETEAADEKKEDAKEDAADEIWVYEDGAAAAPADGELVTADALPAEAQFDPNKDYDKYTVVEYTIEDIQADLVCTVSAKEDNSEFYLECNFYGDDQMTKTTYDGKEFKIEEDKTGFMATDTPAILEKALEQNLWVAIEK